MTLLIHPSPAQAEAPLLEYQVKAAFLFNFAKFVEWPPQVFPDEASPISIGVLGSNPFGNVLSLAVQDQKLDKRPIEIKQSASLEELQDCQLLFISRAEENAVAGVLEQLKGKSILTVGETQSFADGGGVIQFLEKDGKIRFKINQKAAKEANLKISARLLSLAESS